VGLVVFAARETAEGEGARVKRLFPSSQVRHFDPFVLLDEFFVAPDAGFPEHPHAGFEAITYMLEGSFRHRDSLGNDTEVGPGGAQHFSAGRGLVHSEMPGDAPLSHGLQLWVNLPRSRKKSDPTYEQVNPDQIPEETVGSTRIRTILGPPSPVKIQAPAIFRHVLLLTDSAFEVSLPDGYRGFVYVIQGGLYVERISIQPGQALKVDPGQTIKVTATVDTSFVQIAGVPLREPIIIRGSIVE